MRTGVSQAHSFFPSAGARNVAPTTPAITDADRDRVSNALLTSINSIASSDIAILIELDKFILSCQQNSTKNWRNVNIPDKLKQIIYVNHLEILFAPSVAPAAVMGGVTTVQPTAPDRVSVLKDSIAQKLEGFKDSACDTLLAFVDSSIPGDRDYLLKLYEVSVASSIPYNSKHKSELEILLMSTVTPTLFGGGIKTLSPKDHALINRFKDRITKKLEEFKASAYNAALNFIDSSTTNITNLIKLEKLITLSLSGPSIFKFVYRSHLFDVVHLQLLMKIDYLEMLFTPIPQAPETAARSDISSNSSKDTERFVELRNRVTQKLEEFKDSAYNAALNFIDSSTTNITNLIKLEKLITLSLSGPSSPICAFKASRDILDLERLMNIDYLEMLFTPILQAPETDARSDSSNSNSSKDKERVVELRNRVTQKFACFKDDAYRAVLAFIGSSDPDDIVFLLQLDRLVTRFLGESPSRDGEMYIPSPLKERMKIDNLSWLFAPIPVAPQILVKAEDIPAADIDRANEIKNRVARKLECADPNDRNEGILRDAVMNGQSARAGEEFKKLGANFTREHVHYLITANISKERPDDALYALTEFGFMLSSEEQSEFAYRIIALAGHKGNYSCLKRALKDLDSKLDPVKKSEMIFSIITYSLKPSNNIRLASIQASSDIRLATMYLAQRIFYEFAKELIPEDFCRVIVAFTEVGEVLVVELAFDQVGEKLSATHIHTIVAAALSSGGFLIAKAAIKKCGLKLTDETFASLSELTPPENLPQIDFQEWRKAHHLDQAFNHINNHQSGSILSSINGLACIRAKLYYMKLAIRFLENLPESEFASLLDCIRDILLNDDIYATDQYIDRFIVERVMADVIRKGRNDSLRTIKQNEINRFVRYLNSLSDEDRVTFMLKNNHFFVQLLYHGLTSDDPVTKNGSLEIAKFYGKIPQIRACLEQFLGADGEVFQEAEGAVPRQINIIMLVNDPSKISGVTHVGCMDDYFTQCLYGRFASGVNWDNVILFKYDESANNAQAKPWVEGLSLEELFLQLPIFMSNFLFYHSQQKFIEFISLLQLGDYEQKFVEAAKTKFLTSTKKLVSEPVQRELNAGFNRFLIPEEACQLVQYKPNDPINNSEGEAVQASIDKLKSISLKDEFVNEIYKVFNYQNKPSGEKAQLLLCLAELFARYSSSHIFGTEDNSPEALRRISYAFLKKAFELDNNVVTEESFKSWQANLLGLGMAFTCTALLASSMMGVTQHFPIRSTTIPPIWC